MRRRDFMRVGMAAPAILAHGRSAWAQPVPGPGARLFQSLSYSPSGVALEGEMARGFPEPRIRLDIERIKKVTGAIRIYSVDHGLDRVLPMAAASGINVSLGLRLGADKTHNDLEIARGMKLFVPCGKIIKRVYVGNEVLRRKILSPADLAGYVRRVRVFIADPAVSIGTAEIWSDWLKNPDLTKACDFVGAHVSPYRDGVAVAGAVEYIAQRSAELKAMAPGKPIVIAEAGWPSAGPTIKDAVPSLAAQDQFARAFLARAAQEKYDYNFVEAYDQPWKSRSAEGPAGASWGLFDGQRAAKIPLVAG